MDTRPKHNVTLRNEDSEYFPCPVCGELKELLLSKRGKPYLTCNDCGVQLFIRGKEGIKKLGEQVPDYSALCFSKSKLALLDQYSELQKKLVEIRGEKPIFGNNEHLDIQEGYLVRQAEILKIHLQKEINPHFKNQ